MPLTNYSLDTFIAPRLSKLTMVGAPDLSGCTKGYSHWVNSFILNTMLRIRLPRRDRQLAIYFLKKVEGAFYEYHEGRTFLESYLQNRGQAISSYFHSLRHFEAAASLAYHAYETTRRMNGKKLFTKKDGSPLQRLNRLQNLSKHASEELLSGSIPDELSIPIWLTDEGIECHDTTLSFSEFAELLLELAKCAEVLSNPPLPEK